MYFDRKMILSTPSRIYRNQERQRIRVNLWVPSQVDEDNAASHVFVSKTEHLCSRYKATPLLMEANMRFVLDPNEELWATTEDQAVLGISTEPA